MNKSAKSQWDFGELFPVETTRKVLSIGELTEQIRRLLEKQVGTVWVSGEITNFRAQLSGHLYFTLKDANAQIACVLFRGENVPHREFISDGQKLLVQGEVTVYEARGQYQLIVRAVELQGVGALQIAFEKLKQKLAADGLFARERKRPLPKYPQRIGLVTSPSGAAIRDVCHVVQRRNPSLEIVLLPCRVQGDGAAREIVEAIRLLNMFGRSPVAPHSSLDLILVTRGGGSLEDLWAFNEEMVARAIFESALPVVSAVGHEIDVTISDFVADVRAATPSAAAEIITEGVFSSCQFVGEAASRMRKCVLKQLAAKSDEIHLTQSRLNRAHPRRKFNEWLQRLDDLQGDLLRSVKLGVRHQQVALQNYSERLRRVRPALLLKQQRELFIQECERLQEAMHHRMRERRDYLKVLDSRLQLLGPEQVLSRGYSLTTDAATGKVLRDAADVRGGQWLKTRLKTGEISSRAESK